MDTIFLTKENEKAYDTRKISRYLEDYKELRSMTLDKYIVECEKMGVVDPDRDLAQYRYDQHMKYLADQLAEYIEKYMEV